MPLVRRPPPSGPRSPAPPAPLPEPPLLPPSPIPPGAGGLSLRLFAKGLLLYFSYTSGLSTPMYGRLR